MPSSRGWEGLCGPADATPLQVPLGEVHPTAPQEQWTCGPHLPADEALLLLLAAAEHFQEQGSPHSAFGFNDAQITGQVLPGIQALKLGGNQHSMRT